MLTMSRLVGGLLFAGLAWITTQTYIPYFQEAYDGRTVGMLAEVNAGFGFLMGWLIAGPRAGDGWNASISYGLTAAVAAAIVCLFFQSGAEMIRLSLDKRYDGPMEAVTNVFELMIEYGALLLRPDVLVVALGGGVIAGLIVELTGRNFR